MHEQKMRDREERRERREQLSAKPKFYEIKEGMDLNKSGKDVLKMKKEKK